MKVACTVRSGGKSALTTELIMGSAKAADYLSLWARPRGLPVHHQPHLDGAGAGHCCQQLSDHQPGRRGRQVPGHLADRPGHLAYHRAQAGACAHPAPDGVLNSTGGRFSFEPPPLIMAQFLEFIIIEINLWSCSINNPLSFSSAVMRPARSITGSLGIAGI